MEWNNKSRIIVWLQQTTQFSILHNISLLLHNVICNEMILLLVPLFAWLSEPRKGSMFVMFISVTGLLNATLKWFFLRPRPFWASQKIKNLSGKWVKEHSFPSSHAQLSSTFSTLVWLFYLKNSNDKLLFVFFMKCVIIILPILTGISRIYLGVHYPFCVVIGWIVGILYGYTMHTFYVDIIEWFINLSETNHWLFSFIFPILIYLILFLIKVTNKLSNKKVTEKWIELGTKNTFGKLKINETNIIKRDLKDYDFPIWSLFGGLIGTTINIKYLMLNKLSFIEETCTSKHLNIQIYRALIGYIVLIGFIVPICYVLPKYIKKKHNLCIATTVQRVGFCMFGIWLIFGLPYFAKQYFALQCPIFECNNEYQNEFETIIDLNCTPPQHILQLPKTLIEPMNLNELQNEIKLANEQNYKLRVGGGFSLMPRKLHTNHYYKDTFNETVKFISLRHFNKYETVENETNGNIYVTVGGGLYLGEHSDLNISWNDTLTQKLWNDGLALPNLGGSTAMTVAGWFSTGSQGSGLKYSSFDSIVGIKYVNGKGEMKQVWRNDTNPQHFYAVGVSMGLIGIIYELIFKAEPFYFVEYAQHLQNGMPLSFWIQHLQDFETDYGETFCVSAIDRDEGAFCYKWHSNRVYYNKNDTILDYYNVDELFELLTLNQYKSLHIRNAFSRNPTECLTKYGNNLCKLKYIDDVMSNDETIGTQKCLKAIKKQYKSGTYSYLNTHVDINCVLAVSSSFDTYDYNKKNVLKQWHKGLVFEMSAFPLFTDEICEIIFPLSESQTEQQLLISLSKMFKDESKPVELISIYKGKASQFWLSPMYNSNVLRINIFCHIPQDIHVNCNKKFLDFIQYFDSNGFKYRLHWGKTIPFLSDYYLNKEMIPIIQKIKDDYVKLNQFKEIASLQDPNGIFRTKYWDSVFWKTHNYVTHEALKDMPLEPERKEDI